MRLFQCLMRKPMPGGNIFTGRHRLQFQPNAAQRGQLRWELEVEEENMLYLRHPYLTKAQSRGHMAHIDRWAAERHRLKTKQMNSFWKSVRLEDKLNHLRHSESWGE